MKKQKRNPSANRYGIGQWFGKSPEFIDRDELSKIATYAELDNSEVICPFSSSLGSDKKCGKKGGVCSIRAISPQGYTVDSRLVTTCPERFLEGNIVLSEIGRFMLGSERVKVAKEVPFLKSTNANSKEESDSGRIDWVVQDLNDSSRFCGVEFQSMYFSGAKMQGDFMHFKNGGSYPFYPDKSRRPDYRSSGPKRLAPQLGIKVPMLAAWKKSMAVVVDKYFLSCMDGNFLSDLPEKSDEQHNPGDVGFFVVDYNVMGKIRIDRIFNVRLENLLSSLNSSREMTEEAFTERLKEIMSRSERSFLI